LAWHDRSGRKESRGEIKKSVELEGVWRVKDREEDTER